MSFRLFETSWRSCVTTATKLAEFWRRLIEMQSSKDHCDCDLISQICFLRTHATNDWWSLVQAKVWQKSYHKSYELTHNWPGFFLFNGVGHARIKRQKMPYLQTAKLLPITWTISIHPIETGNTFCTKRWGCTQHTERVTWAISCNQKHESVITWRRFLHHWPFMRINHCPLYSGFPSQKTINSHRETNMLLGLIKTWINSRVADELPLYELCKISSLAKGPFLQHDFT